MVATVERAQARSSGGIAVTPGRGVVDALVGYAACAPGGGPGSIVVLMLTPLSMLLTRRLRSGPAHGRRLMRRRRSVPALAGRCVAA